MDEVRTVASLHAETDRNRYEFLDTDLELCFTFVNVVQTELALDDWDAAKRALNKAEQGYATIEQFLPHVRNNDLRIEIERRLDALRSALNAARRHVRPFGAIR
jgi:hypothetical protein